MVKTRLYRKVTKFYKHASATKRFFNILNLESEVNENRCFDLQKALKYEKDILNFVRIRYQKFKDQIDQKLEESRANFSAPEFEIHDFAFPIGAGISMRYSTEQHSIKDSRFYKEILNSIVPELKEFARKTGIWMLEVKGPEYSGLEIITNKARGKR